jgi:hypothetical protein
MSRKSFKLLGIEGRLDRLYTDGYRPAQVEGNELMTDLAELIEKAVIIVKAARANDRPLYDLEEDIVLCFMSAAVHVSIERMGPEDARAWVREAAAQIRKQA